MLFFSCSIQCCALLQLSCPRGFPKPCLIWRVQDHIQKKGEVSSMQGVVVGFGWLFVLLCPNSNTFSSTPILCHPFLLVSSNTGTFILLWLSNLVRHLPYLDCWRRSVSLSAWNSGCVWICPFHRVHWSTIVVGCSTVPCRCMGFVWFCWVEGAGHIC
jgi:hypothetical protein